MSGKPSDNFPRCSVSFCIHLHPFCWNHVSERLLVNVPTASDSAAFLLVFIYIPPCLNHASDKLPANLPTASDSAACLLACIYFPFAGIMLPTSFWQLDSFQHCSISFRMYLCPLCWNHASDKLPANLLTASGIAVLSRV